MRIGVQLDCEFACGSSLGGAVGWLQCWWGCVCRFIFVGLVG